MKSVLITGIKELITPISPSASGLIKGKDMGEIQRIKNAYILIEGDEIIETGPSGKGPGRADYILDLENKKIVLPCWCDSHTHIVYAGSREQEFVDRIHGLSYEEIAGRGGGILNSARKLRETPEEILLEAAYSRLKEVIGYGTSCIEIKSGYGLSPESELKMLRVIAKLRTLTNATIKSTYLGAHAIPLAFKSKRRAYILQVIDTIPRIALEGLAEYIDVFCDTGFFTVNETDEILKAAGKYGLKPKIHANELAISGGVQVGVANSAVSVDHLERIGPEEIEVLKNSSTVPTVLPSTSFFLNLPYAPARQMIRNGLGLALASDYNPGSTPSGRMPFVLSLACIKMRLKPEEALTAATYNGACAMELQHSNGSLEIGKSADMIITKEIPSFEFIPYAFGTDLVEKVIIKGIIQ